MSFIRHVFRGCGRLRYCGQHPGSGVLVGLILLGGLALSDLGLMGFLMGCLLMAIFFLPIYLAGAYDRSKEEERIENMYLHRNLDNDK